MSRWRAAPHAEEASRRLAGEVGVSALAARVLLNRDLGDPHAARMFLTPRFDDLSDPFGLIDMDRAVDRIASAVRGRVPITVYGDYDADGVTATAILVRTLLRYGAQVEAYIPDRREGYGLSEGAVARLAELGVNLVVAVDCGVTATAAADVARHAGVDLIILDHHEVLGDLPSAVAVVDPKRPEAAAAAADYCAAGLALQTARALSARLDPGSAGQGLDDVLELAALGTVADAVTLLGDNRIIVSEGLRRLERPSLPGLAALADAANVRAPLRTRDLSHSLAPRINAAGRLAHASTALNLLLTHNLDEARQLAAELDALNRERRALCDTVLADAIEEVERRGYARDPAIALARDGWHPGVIGIVASQLVERYHRPAVLVGLRDGVGRGSARSIPALHLVDALTHSSGHLTGFGGHAMAAGLTVQADAFERFRADFLDIVGRRLRPEDFEPVVEVDAETRLDELTPEAAGDVERLAPFGSGNPEPVFAVRGLRAVGTRLVGDGSHLRLVVTDGARTADAIAFRQAEHVELLAFTQARVDLAFTLERDRWNNSDRIQLVVEDLQTPDVDIDFVAADAAQVLDRLFARADDYLDLRLDAVEHAAAFNTKVVGVTFEGRQERLPHVRPGDRLRLVRDPRNPRDPHAIQVCALEGGQLGFLRASLAARLAPAMDAGARYAAAATAVTGGGDRAWGLNIYVQRESGWMRESERDGDDVERDGAQPRSVNERLVMALGRGRPVGETPRRISDAVRAGRRLVAAIGPGRGLLASVVASAVSLASAARAPSAGRAVAVVLPRAGDVEAWYPIAGSVLREMGLRTAAAHGGLDASAEWRLAAALERGSVDVLVVSLAWAQRHPEASAAVVAVLDAQAGAADLDMLASLTPALQVVTGPLSPAVIAEVQRRWPAIENATPAAAVRDNLRVVDRRGQSVEDALRLDIARRDKTLVVVRTPAESVTLAAHLRGRYPEAAGTIAYYHAGLPVALRRVLEDLFAAGRITTLVTAMPLVPPAAPVDVTRLVAVGLPSSRVSAAEALAAAGLGGRTGTIELCYGADTFAAARVAADLRFPDRATLVKCYRALREAAGGGPWSLPAGVDDPLPGSGLSRELVTVCLDVLTGAGAVSREDAGDVAQFAIAESSGRIDLTRSLRHLEGERERAALADLRGWALGPAGAILGDLARA
jgi:single-stranded-DNA-specific exonuclease